MKLTMSSRDKLPKLTQGAKNHMDRGAWQAAWDLKELDMTEVTWCTHIPFLLGLESMTWKSIIA